MDSKTSALLFFCVVLVAGCGGGGDDTPPALGSLSSKLFVADAGNSSISSATNVNPPAGTLSFSRIVVGANTILSNNVRSLAIDVVNGRLYVANGSSILVFNNIGTINGNIRPSRVITHSLFTNITSLYLDTVNDVLYAGDETHGIWVFHDASLVNGASTPNREITGNFATTSFQIRDIFVDTNKNILYVSRAKLNAPASDDILAFTASTADGSSAVINHTITPSPTMNVGRIFVDIASDRLFMSDTGSNTVRVFDNVSAATGSVSADRTINLGAPTTDIVVDTTNNRLYALNTGTLFIVNNASTADGSIIPKALTAPGGSILTAVAIRP